MYMCVMKSKTGRRHGNLPEGTTEESLLFIDNTIWFHAGCRVGEGGTWSATVHSECHQRTSLVTLQVKWKWHSLVQFVSPCDCWLELMVFFPLRTLEYLSKHLTHLAAFSSQTNMHARNLALVWAPNLLRWVDTPNLHSIGNKVVKLKPC